MAQDIIKPKGPTKRSSPDRGGSNPRIAPIIGIVKDNVDPTRSGKIMVYISDNSGLDPNNKDNWRPVRFLSPFFGATIPDAPNKQYGTYKANPSSYGMWMAPPDIGTSVVCIFIDGDMNYGFYIGCVPQPETLQMVPAIGATDNIVPNEGEAKSFGGAKRLPVTNINTNNKDIADSTDYLTAAKPVHSYSAAIMNQQGVIRDPVRGPISSSSQRESPSRVGWGVSTPGRPIYEGGFDDTSIAENLQGTDQKSLRVVSRRGGHSIVMDDGDIIGRDQLVRIRTALGHQILMSDDGQTLMILHSNGQSYVELGKEGTVDIYATNSINLRTQGDLNLHADNDVNIHATKNLNIQGENIHINSEKEFKQRTGADYKSFVTGKHLTKVGGAMSMESAGDISMASSAQAYVNGSKVLLNSGQTSTKPEEVPAIDKTLHTDTLFDKEKGFMAAPGKLVSITSRAPAHAPWANAGQGVDVKTSLDAASSLPASPSASTQAVNATAASAGVSNPVQAASQATAPAAGAASKALDKGTTQAITAQVATDAANGPLKGAVTQGTAIAKTAEGTTVGVGQFAQTPQQLEQSGILKPGAAALVTSVAAATGNVQAAMTDNLFTGKAGAENLKSLVTNIPAQTESVVKNIQAAQTKLQNAGAISGAEAGQSLGGMVMSAAKNGVGATLSAVKGAAGGALAGVSALKGKAAGALKDIASGNFAAKMGEMGQGALNGLQSSVSAMAKSPSLASVIEQGKGIAAGAFSAIKASFKPMQAGVPQNLSALAKESAAETIAASASAVSSAATQAGASLLGSKATQAASGMLNKATDKITGIKSSAMAAGSSIASGVAGGASLPSAGSVADSLVGAARGVTTKVAANAQDLVQSLPSTSLAVNTASSAFASAESLIKNPGSAVSSLIDTAKTTGAGFAGSAASTIASGLSNLPGGQSAAASVTNLAKSAIPSLPGTGDLKASLQGKATDALNKIAGSGGALAEKAKGALGDLKSLASAGLPAGAAAQLQSAMGSIASAGSGIKMPSVALNTTDRSGIKSAVKDQLGDPAIPEPKFGEVDEGAKSKVDEIEKAKQEFIAKSNELYAARAAALKEYDKVGDEFRKLDQTLPQGDPAIEAARKKLKPARLKWEEAGKAIEKYETEWYAKNSPSSSTTTGTAAGIGAVT